MTPEQFERFMDALETINTRLGRMEKDSSDSSQATQALSDSMGKIQELYVALDQKSDDNAAMFRNYVDATRELRTETTRLHSEVRSRLKAM